MLDTESQITPTLPVNIWDMFGRFLQNSLHSAYVPFRITHRMSFQLASSSELILWSGFEHIRTKNVFPGMLTCTEAYRTQKLTICKFEVELTKILRLDQANIRTNANMCLIPFSFFGVFEIPFLGVDFLGRFLIGASVPHSRHVTRRGDQYAGMELQSSYGRKILP